MFDLWLASSVDDMYPFDWKAGLGQSLPYQVTEFEQSQFNYRVVEDLLSTLGLLNFSLFSD